MTKMLESEVSSDWLRRNADLSRLELTAEEILELVPQLGQILEYVDQLQSVRTDGIKPWIHPLSELLEGASSTALRVDQEMLPEDLQSQSDRILEGAPQLVERALQVPEAVSQGGSRSP